MGVACTAHQINSKQLLPSRNHMQPCGGAQSRCDPALRTWNSRFHGRRPCRWCAVHMPRSSSGTAMARPPLMEASGRSAAAVETNAACRPQCPIHSGLQAGWCAARWPEAQSTTRTAGGALTDKHRLVGGSRRKLASVDALCCAVGQPAAPGRRARSLCLSMLIAAAKASVERQLWWAERARDSMQPAHLMSMKWPPPAPLACGLSTPWHSAVAMAASTALPPSRSTAAPAERGKRSHLGT